MKELKLLWKITSIIVLTIFAATTIVMLILVPLFGLPQYYTNEAKMYVVVTIASIAGFMLLALNKDKI